MTTGCNKIPRCIEQLSSQRAGLGEKISVCGQSVFNKLMISKGKWIKTSGRLEATWEYGKKGMKVVR